MLLYHLIEKRILLGYLGAQRIPEHSTDSLKAYSEGRVPASFQFFFFLRCIIDRPAAVRSYGATVCIVVTKFSWRKQTKDILKSVNTAQRLRPKTRKQLPFVAEVCGDLFEKIKPHWRQVVYTIIGRFIANNYEKKKRNPARRDQKQRAFSCQKLANMPHARRLDPLSATVAPVVAPADPIWN